MLCFRIMYYNLYLNIYNFPNILYPINTSCNTIILYKSNNTTVIVITLSYLFVIHIRNLIRYNERFRKVQKKTDLKFSLNFYLLYEYRDLFIDMVVRNNRSELAIANRHQER